MPKDIQSKIEHTRQKLKEYQDLYDNLPYKTGIIATMQLGAVNYFKSRLKKLEKDAQKTH